MEGQLPGGVLPLCRGDMLTLVAHMVPTTIATAVCVGALRLVWRRRPGTSAAAPHGLPDGEAAAHQPGPLPVQDQVETEVCACLPAVQTSVAVFWGRTWHTRCQAPPARVRLPLRRWHCHMVRQQGVAIGAQACKDDVLPPLQVLA
jgi:hypothetical protein